MNHKFFNCTCNEPYCIFCEDDLGLCTVCGGFEGTLTTDCCGHKVEEEILEIVYSRKLDYLAGQGWVVFEQKCDNCVRRDVTDNGVYRFCTTPMPGKKVCKQYYRDWVTPPSS